MRNSLKRVAFTCVSVVAAGALAGSPAHAAENPYTPEKACAGAEGGIWNKLHGPAALEGPDGQVIAEVYLMREPGTNRKCVATVKRADIGVETGIQAVIQLEGYEPSAITVPHEYYASVVVDTRGRRVLYAGAMYYKKQEFAVEFDRLVSG